MLVHMYDAFRAARQKPCIAFSSKLSWYHSYRAKFRHTASDTFVCVVRIEVSVIACTIRPCKLPTNVFVLAGIVAPLLALLKSEENSVLLKAAELISWFKRDKGRAFVQAGQPL